MKTLSALIVLFLAMSLLGCQDTNDAPKAALQNVSAFRNIGHQIPLETGLRWMEAYNKKNSIQGRDETTGYFITASELQSGLQAIPNLTGVVFHHAIDDAGEHHFITIPIDESLSVWSYIPERKYIDANTNSEISAVTARLWALNYELAYPEEVWFHFFGKDIFDEIAAIPYFTTLNIEPAINDQNLTPQLLLIIANEQTNTGGRTNGYDEAMVYDASSPCPPCAVE
jgi:hypothetical protein